MFSSNLLLSNCYKIVTILLYLAKTNKEDETMFFIINSCSPSLPLLNKNILKKSLILSYLGFIFLFFYDILFVSVYKAIRGDNYVY